MAEQNSRMTDRLFVRRVLIVLGLAALFFLVWQLRTVLLMLFGAVVIATIFRAVADAIRRFTRLPAMVATGLSILIILGTLIGLIALFGAHILQQVQTLRETLPAAWHALEQRIGDIGLSEQFDQLVATVSAPGGGSLSEFGRTLLSVGSGIADLLVVILVALLELKDQVAVHSILAGHRPYPELAVA